MQTQLEKDTHQPFVGLSVSETIYKCTMLGQQSKSSKVKSEFKVPDKRYWWIKLRALVEVRDWENLEKLAKSKSSPIGYEVREDKFIDMHSTSLTYWSLLSRNVSKPSSIKKQASISWNVTQQWDRCYLSRLEHSKKQANKHSWTKMSRD